MKKLHRTTRISSQDAPRARRMMTDEEKQQVSDWIAAGYSDIEASRAAFRAWGRDVSPSTIYRRREKEGQQ